MDIKIILQQQINKSDYNTHLNIFKYIVKQKIVYELNKGITFDIEALNNKQIKRLLKITKRFQIITNEMESLGND